MLLEVASKFIMFWSCYCHMQARNHNPDNARVCCLKKCFFALLEIQSTKILSQHRLNKKVRFDWREYKNLIRPIENFDKHSLWSSNNPIRCLMQINVKRTLEEIFWLRLPVESTRSTKWNWIENFIAFFAKQICETRPRRALDRKRFVYLRGILISHTQSLEMFTTCFTSPEFPLTSNNADVSTLKSQREKWFRPWNRFFHFGDYARMESHLPLGAASR